MINDPSMFFMRSSKKAYDFALINESIEKCANLQIEEHSNFFKEDVIYAKYSLKNVLFEDGYELNALNDAEIMTYPTKFLTKSLAKFFVDEFHRDICWFSLKLTSFSNSKGDVFVANYKDDILQYDAKTKKYLAFETFDIEDKSQCWIKADALNVEDDVAGRIKYCIFLPNTTSLQKNAISQNFVKKMIEIGNQYGYDFIAYSRHETNNGLCFYVAYESRLQKSNITINDKLYHLAPLNKKDKILKNGLAPKSNTPNIRHRDKIYLFNCYDLYVFVSFLRQIQHMSTIYDKNTKMLKQSKDFALFEIDRNKLHNDIKLYRDNNFESKDPKNPIALYTYSNIPPNAISFKDTISV